MPLNETRPMYQLYQAKYPFDSEQYYYCVVLHIAVSAIVLQTAAISVDSMYVKCVYHVCGKFAVIE